MSHDFCMDCGALLFVRSKICPVCGFDNYFDPYQDTPLDGEWSNDSMDYTVPEN